MNIFLLIECFWELESGVFEKGEGGEGFFVYFLKKCFRDV